MFLSITEIKQYLIQIVKKIARSGPAVFQHACFLFAKMKAKRTVRLLKFSMAFLVFSFLTVFLSDQVVKLHAKGKLFDTTDKIKHNKVGLLLGTAKITQNGRMNLYYKYRIEATVKLYNAGKIDYVLVSGDNSSKDYDEPTTIKADLIARGIPPKRIYLDYAGFRTFDSVIRSKEIFGQKKITIISQKFHNERALFIARMKGISAVAYNSKEVPYRYGIKVVIREKFARVKMILDLLFGKKPKFLGEKILIR